MAGGLNLDFRPFPAYNFHTVAGVTQLAECLLPKQNVVGSSPITRSLCRGIGPITNQPMPAGFLFSHPVIAEKSMRGRPTESALSRHPSVIMMESIEDRKRNNLSLASPFCF
jgi:hypothetical protein